MLWFSGAAMRLVILTLFVWKNTGFYVVILSARLSRTPKEQLEAAAPTFSTCSSPCIFRTCCRRSSFRS